MFRDGFFSCLYLTGVAAAHKLRITVYYGIFSAPGGAFLNDT